MLQGRQTMLSQGPRAGGRARPSPSRRADATIGEATAVIHVGCRIEVESRGVGAAENQASSDGARAIINRCQWIEVGRERIRAARSQVGAAAIVASSEW